MCVYIIPIGVYIYMYIYICYIYIYIYINVCNITCIHTCCRPHVSPSDGLLKSSEGPRLGVLTGLLLDSSVDFRNFIVFFEPRPWHIEIRHRDKKTTSTINLLGFETLKSTIRRLQLWRPTVLQTSGHTPSSHSKNSLSKICFKGWVAQKPYVLIGSFTAALRFSKGWVRKDTNLGLRTGCTML